MNITDIIVTNIVPEKYGVCGEFSLLLDNEICIHRVLLIKGDKGFFVAFPNFKKSDSPKKYIDFVHPLNKTVRDKITNEVVSKYYKELKERE